MQQSCRLPWAFEGQDVDDSAQAFPSGVGSSGPRDGVFCALGTVTLSGHVP